MWYPYKKTKPECLIAQGHPGISMQIYIYFLSLQKNCQNRRGTFYGCTALTSITLPASLTEIAQYSFYGCTALKTIKFSENATLATIGDYGFYDCPMLHTADMSNCNQVTKIGASAFESSDEMRLFKIGTVVPPTCGSTPFGAVGNYSVLKVPDGAVTQYQSASGWKDFASITGLNE